METDTTKTASPLQSGTAGSEARSDAGGDETSQPLTLCTQGNNSLPGKVQGECENTTANAEGTKINRKTKTEDTAIGDSNDKVGKTTSGAKTSDGDETAEGVDEEGEHLELQIPQEHARLDSLLTQIPKKAQHGLLMQCDLILTCMDANEHYIALGTNIGLTFLYSRKDHSMQRLKSETTSDVITCVRLHHGVDHQLATGMASGTLCIFLIPSFISLHKKQLQKFDVRSVHRHYLTCVEWSTNGMKLFSGDKTGHVVVTEVDFYQGQCKSSLLLVEPPTEVVQLNYDHKVLLVSTKHRAFVCRLDTTREAMHIGQQDRKVQGTFGATFIPALCKVQDAMLYAVRPGCRVWLADMQGSVCNTHIFKDHVSAGLREIPILKPSRSSYNPNTELQFGRLHMYGEHRLVTYNTSTLFVLEPRLNRVVASQSRLGGIVDVAVHKDEIFVLRRHADSAVVRIAYEAEPLLPKAMPFDLPLSPTAASASTTTTTTTTTIAVTTTTTTNTVPSETSTTTQKQENKEENKTKTFFKKTFLSPFKKLDNFIHEHTHKEPAAVSELDLKPVIRGTSDEGSTKTSPSSSLQTSQESSPDLPPVVALHSPDLALHVFMPTDVQSPDSADSALSVFAEEAKVKDTGAGPEPEAGAGTDTGPGQTAVEATDASLQPSAPQGGGDIIFSHQMNKKKAKKKKGKGKAGDKDADNVSQSSFGSQGGEDGKAVGQPPLPPSDQDNDVLQRAEEALSSVDRLLKGGSDNTHEGEPEGRRRETVLGEASGPAGEGGVGKDGDEADSVLDLAAINAMKEAVAPKLVPGAEHVPGAAHDSCDGQSAVSVAEGQQGRGVRETTVDHPTGNAPSRPSLTALPVQPSDPARVVAPGQTVPPPLSSTQTGVPVSEVSAEGGTKQTGVPVSEVSAEGGTKQTGVTVSEVSGEAGTKQTGVPVGEVSAEGATGQTEAQKVEDPLLAVERSLDAMTHQGRPPVKKEDSVDDFYSMFSAPYSPDSWESPSSTPREHRSFADFDTSNTAVAHQASRGSGSSERSVAEATVQTLANSWSEFTAPANIYSLALSATHVWFTDKSENLYYSGLGATKGIVWRKVSEPASQISVSPSGHIVWRLHRGRVFAGTKITQRRPEGLKWVEAVSNVAHVSADDHCAWYVKKNGEVMMQRGLSKERPCFRSLSVETECRVKEVVARHGVVWAVTDTMEILVRTGITNDAPQGTAWHRSHRETEPLLFFSVSVDSEGIGWAVDVLGQIWFTDRVTPQTPQGSGRWWQVPLSEYYVQDPSVLDEIRSLVKKYDPLKLSRILSTSRKGLIVAGVQGVWLALDYLNTLYVCRSSLQGYQWSVAQPPQMASSTAWKQVQAAVADLDWGMVWAQAANGELYALHPESRDATLIDSKVFVSFSVNQHAVWGLTSDGELYIRTGMGQHCPQGVDWTLLDLVQLGDVFLVHVTCSSSYVWVVDEDGQVFHRIGAAAPRPGQLNPVWLPIDTYSEIIFTKVVNGPLDWMVWAVDNRRLTYVRLGISDDLPIGREWLHVPGIQAMDLCLSSSGVWALNTNGEILFRYGITEDDVSGNYWKKIPGCFTKISASSKDVLWAVNTAGQLVKCSSRHLFRRQDSADPLMQRTISTASEEGDWELV